MEIPVNNDAINQKCPIKCAGDSATHPEFMGGWRNPLNT
jgi:hypothetical protein